MVSTMLRCITSSASSLGVQWVTGRPLSSGTSQATPMICVSCSAVNVEGVPGRSWSANSADNSWVRSFSLTPSCSTAARRASFSAQRILQRRTRCRSMLRRRPCSELLIPAADIWMSRDRSTRRYGVPAWFRVRLSSCSLTPLVRDQNSLILPDRVVKIDQVFEKGLRAVSGSSRIELSKPPEAEGQRYVQPARCDD